MDEKKRATFESYERDALANEQHFLKLQNYKEENYVQFVSALGGKQILDAGCGPGIDALALTKLGCTVLCADYSPKFLQICQKHGLATHLMDLEAIDLPEQSFDGIWASAALLHVPKQNTPAVLQALHKLLRKNGIIYISLKIGDGERMVVDRNMERFFAFWQPDEIRALVEKQFSVFSETYAQGPDGQRWIYLLCRAH